MEPIRRPLRSHGLSCRSLERHAAIPRPVLNILPLPTAATVAVAIIRPIPGSVTDSLGLILGGGNETARVQPHADASIAPRIV